MKFVFTSFLLTSVTALLSACQTGDDASLNVRQTPESETQASKPAVSAAAETSKKSAEYKINFKKEMQAMMEGCLRAIEAGSPQGLQMESKGYYKSSTRSYLKPFRGGSYLAHLDAKLAADRRLVQEATIEFNEGPDWTGVNRCSFSVVGMSPGISQYVSMTPLEQNLLEASLGRAKQLGYQVVWKKSRIDGSKLIEKLVKGEREIEISAGTTVDQGIRSVGIGLKGKK